MSNYKKRFMKIFVCILVAMFVILCICSGFKDMVVYAETNEESEGLSDSEILQYYEKPNIEQDFENDKINIIIKEKYNKLEIGFDTFKCIDSIATIESITYKTEKIYYGASKVIKLCGEKNPIITLELITKEKIIILDAVSKLQDEEIILIAEPSYLYEPEEQWIPEDPYYASQWGLNDINGINAEDAWDCGRGDSSGIKVGIMESGAEVSHEDLQGRVFYGNFTPEEGTKISHGTHVAGIIGAKHNSVGIAGVSQPYMYILNRSSADFAESLIYAEQNDIKIINASFSYIVKDTGEYASFSATHYAALSNYSGLFIASAGNDAVNIDINRMYPACYAVSNVITVGSLDSNDTRSSFSNYGENSVDIYAPGDNIISTLQNNQYGYKSGTSMAAPHVAGLAALLLDTEPALSANRLKEIILDSADTITINTPDGTQSVKKLNAANAMESITGVRSLFDGGNGGDEPFEISNETQLRNMEFAHRPVYVPMQGSEEQINYNFVLTSNITLSGDWMPFSYKFTGDFDGNGYTISYNMTLNQADVNQQNYLGLFSYVGEGAVIKDLRLERCEIKNADTFTQLTAPNNSYVNVGILAGIISGATEITSVTIYDCLIDVNAARTSMGTIAGGNLFNAGQSMLCNGGRSDML